MIPQRGALNHDEVGIHDGVKDMARLAERAIERALDCLRRRDTALARRIAQDDAEVNERQRLIEETFLAMIAGRRPAAGDLRALVTDIHVAVELERIADHAAGIAAIVPHMGADVPPAALDDIVRMADLCRAMFARALEAWSKRNPAPAPAAGAEDRAVDRLEQQIRGDQAAVTAIAHHRHLVAVMGDGQGDIASCAYLLWVVHNLERIADRATNIVERVIFSRTGRNPDLNR